MTNRADADFLQVLRREARQNPFVNLILAEDRLVSSRPRLRSQTAMSMMTSPTPRNGYVLEARQ